MISSPLVVAPMAGGTSTPALVIAAAQAGAIGFLAAGYKTPAAMAAEIQQVRSAVKNTGQNFGVNVFVPGEPVVETEQLKAYRERLLKDAALLGAGMPELSPGLLNDTDFWSEKVQLLIDDPVPLVSFTFGLPEAGLVRSLHAAGSLVWATVTSPAEATAAAGLGVDALVVQHNSAGGHSAAFLPAPVAHQQSADVIELMTQLRAAGVARPLIAAGGIGTANRLREVLAAGAIAAQLGTAFVRSIESGARQLHKDALADQRFNVTAITRAFTGKNARALVNRFVSEHPDAPTAYPTVHHLTAPLRAKAAADDDADSLNLWAGTSWRTAQAGPAANIIRALLEAN